MTGKEREHPFVLVTGGCRSGKSAFAQKMVESSTASGLYLATADCRDEEMRRRIAEHRQARGLFWRTLEAGPKDYVLLPAAIAAEERAGQGILFDCLTLWTAGQMEMGLDAGELDAALDALLQALWRTPAPVVLVTNEVGLGLVPPTVAGRRFRDFAGLVNQKAARRAATVILMVSGIPLTVKGSLL